MTRNIPRISTRTKFWESCYLWQSESHFHHCFTDFATYAFSAFPIPVLVRGTTPSGRVLYTVVCIADEILHDLKTGC